MLSLELCLKRKQIRSAVQFRSCLFSYASTGSWSSCDSLHTWSRAAGELCVHYFSAVQSHSSQPAVIIECRSMFLGSQPLPRALILKCDIISGCFSVGETSSKLNKSKLTRLMFRPGRNLWLWSVLQRLLTRHTGRVWSGDRRSREERSWLKIKFISLTF